jgi:virulence-associated protein VagC
MQLTYLFKSGSDQAVIIPRDIAYVDTNIELKITRMDDVVKIFPVLRSLKDAVTALRALPKTLTVEERDPNDMPVTPRD